MVKNYLVGSHYRVKETKWSWKDTADEGDQYELYKRMYQLSRASIFNFLDDEYEEICFQDTIEHIGEAAKLGWRYLRELWESEPCNLLILGPDCQMVKPTKIFNQFDEFRMFNWTDPKSNDGNNTWSVKIPNYFNGDMMYFPHNMKKELWEMYDELHRSWETDNTTKTWGNDQIIANIMFWSQNIPWEQAHRPDLFYQAQWIPHWASLEQQDQWNQFKSTDAHIIHWHASRHVPTKLAAMENVNKVLNIPEYKGILR